MAADHSIALPSMIGDGFELRHLDHRDARALFSLIDRDRAYLSQWQNWPKMIHTVADMDRLIRHSQQKLRQNNGFDMSVWHEGRVAGKIGLVFIDWRQDRTEIGYWLGRNYQGRGLITRACRIVLDHAFDRLGLGRVNIRCATNNRRSRAIPARLGFEYCGLASATVMIHGAIHREAIYGMTAAQWRDQGTIYHITTRTEWAAAQGGETYSAPSLASQGFIHCSRRDQIVKVANAIYVGREDLLILCIAASQVANTLRYEPPDTDIPAAHEDAELFPHIYGPIPIDAVVEAIAFPPGADGRFDLPGALRG